MAEEAGKPISPEEAKKLIDKFQEKYPEQSKSASGSADFVREALAEHDKTGRAIKMQSAINEEGKETIVLSCADKNYLLLPCPIICPE